MSAGGSQQGCAGSGVHKSSAPLTGWGSALFMAADAVHRTATRRTLDDPGGKARAFAGVMMASVVLSPPSKTRCWPREAARANSDDVRTWPSRPSTEVTSGSSCGAASATVGLRRCSGHTFTRREDLLLKTGGARERKRAEQVVPRVPAERNHLSTSSACPRSTAEPVATSLEQKNSTGRAARLCDRWGLPSPHAGADVSNTSEGP
jgi:hypothetical protein